MISKNILGKNIFFFAIIIFILIGEFVYIKREISSIRKEQSSQRENIESFQNLLISDWKIYKNERFRFSFKYPEYGYVCNEQSIEGAELFLNIYFKESCDEAEKAMDPANLRITVKQNKNNYKTPEEAFYKEFSQEFPKLDRYLNPQLGYFKIDKLNAYGGKIINKTSGTWITTSNDYGIIIFKDDYIIKISDSYYEIMQDGKFFGDKPATDAIIASFAFE